MQKFIETVIHAVQTWTDDKIKRSKKQLDDRISNSSADWNQNDSNADSYVKNRPFYKEENIEELIFEGEVHFDENGDYYFDSQIELIEGINYIVVFDGHNYESICYWEEYGGGISLDIITVTGDRLLVDVHRISLGGQSANTIHHVKIFIGSLRVAKKIDAMFIPEDIRKMSTFNPSGTGSFSMNRLNGTAIGYCSHTEGIDNEASGQCSHAEGICNIASSNNSHAEGSLNIASGSDSHAEGSNTEAFGNYSHTEGYYTIARARSQRVSGEYNIPEDKYYPSKKILESAEILCPYYQRNRIYFCDGYTFNKDTGLYTLVPIEYESVLNNSYDLLTRSSGIYVIHDRKFDKTMYYIANNKVFYNNNLIFIPSGSTKYSVIDNQVRRGGKYAHIVGNGTSDTKRSNAHTLDWNGVGWYQGGLQVGGNAQDDGAKNVLLEGDAIPVPETASVGQTLAVKSVDENGKPIEWEVVDASTGGGAGIVASETAPEDTSVLWVDTSDNEVPELNIPSDDHINNLINAALSAIPNTAEVAY